MGEGWGEGNTQRRQIILAALFVLGLAAVPRAYVVLTQLYYIHFDEIYQYFEPAHRLAFASGIVTWEFIDGIRSWAIPGAMAAIMRLAALVSDSPLAYMTTLHALLAATSLSVVWIGFRLGLAAFGLTGALLTGGACAVWFELIYFAPSAMPDVIATHAALGALYLHTRQPPRHRFLAGALYGFAILLRIQYFPPLGLAALWLARRDRGSLKPLCLGALPVVVFWAVLDMLTWGLPLQSVWLHALRNMGQGVSTGFGVEPWWYYAQQFTWYWQAALLLVPLALLGVWRAPLWAFVAAATIATLSLIGHKEYRFIYLALAIAPILLGLGMATATNLLRRHANPRIAAACGLAMFATLTALSLRAGTSGLMEKRFTQRRPMIALTLLAHTRPDLCGLGVGATGPSAIGFLGGPTYSYLHRAVPIYFSDYQPEKTLPGSAIILRSQIIAAGHAVPQFPGPAFAQATPYFNYLIASGNGPPGFTPLNCQPTDPDPICLLHRPGPCTAP